ncbi:MULTISPECIES: GT4 family glycosyltransferase PelF [Streptomyces]|uniref:D-inositol 3-phosphate glycosyltransferase n=1 Tax=Streptomyces caniscabiei TaxID=2746961 RepID=A0ABU4MDT2_9ACTN|nr:MULTISPECIES: GT4 family glycosyltransferase PelF [Streptomyces]MBE4735864.1 GT4 family glycosyltransferase PelF [Streptomyces caniscabiei]MBE4756008.1 GT4 family glycosyltransferase PelF [Streptomyces caniscabiei]MBE4771404.1 GT4 family glycosyltransferase PelF [Streptomyces caniscabiei]MBE4786169.1 GT4 family glycosyltransferase PelF [Streptomyces caniscabiei]MBE4794190.1 GT4 family glycosyltransferase PelF [Streptomyces caniscabiei]
MRNGSHVTMLTEGTYPHVHGGVSTWCDQLVRGMPDVEFHLVSLTGTGREPVTWELPPNVYRHTCVPTWGPRPGRARAPYGAARRRFTDSYERLLLSVLDPGAPRGFEEALYELARLARDGRLSAALRTESALRSLMWIWTMPHLPTAAAHPTVHDALTATDLLEHSLRPLCARIPEDCVAHAVSGGLATLPALAARELDGVPFLLTEHGIYLRERYLGHRAADQRWPVKAFMLGFHRELTRLGYRAADLITPCNRYNRRWEERGGADTARIRTVYNGVDPAAFPHAGPEPEVPTLTWCGRVDPIKDLETLLHAYALVRAELPGTRLRLFGPVPPGGEAYRTELDKLAAELGVTDGLTFEGRVGEVWRAYAAGHVVMLSSISEGFPYSLIEAMSCGRTTVSTDVGGVREAVGDTGIVVPPRDPETMADAALGLLLDHARRRALGESARRRVIDRFTLRRSVDAFRLIYQELAGRDDIVYAPAPATVADWTAELRDPWYRTGATTDGTDR